MLGALLALDNSALQWFASVRTISGTYMAIGISEFGSTVVVVGLAAIAILVLALYRKWPEIAGFILAVGGSGAVALILKTAIHRLRPSIQYAAFRENDFSFPSGHAVKAVALYCFLAFLIARTWPAGRARTIAITLLPALALLISLSRLYLGLHYVSDVLAGIILGSAFVLAGAYLTRMIERRWISPEMREVVPQP